MKLTIRAKAVSDGSNEYAGDSAEVEIDMDASSGYSSRAEPIVGAIDHAFDGARKTLVACLEKMEHRP
jgi:hypothetical protein